MQIQDDLDQKYKLQEQKRADLQGKVAAVEESGRQAAESLREELQKEKKAVEQQGGHSIALEKGPKKGPKKGPNVHLLRTHERTPWIGCDNSKQFQKRDQKGTEKGPKKGPKVHLLRKYA